MYKPEKKYILWINNGCEGWNFREFDTLEECLDEPRYGTDYMITKAVDIEIKEK